MDSNRPLPVFWSDRYGARVRCAGRRREGTPSVSSRAPTEEGSFLGVYERDGRTTAVPAVDRPRAFLRARRELASRELAHVTGPAANPVCGGGGGTHPRYSGRRGPRRFFVSDAVPG
ncbi:oxidoreductase C-terminal domain-containing protein [Streptomyces sp. QHH-9511]|uniref:oxidoreductase C-terminal domain-containing protein n=1 Tax=Streptomyces sp. QHH-9511 TaxID=2684468 RepID=UPI00131A764C